MCALQWMAESWLVGKMLISSMRRNGIIYWHAKPKPRRRKFARCFPTSLGNWPQLGRGLLQETWGNILRIFFTSLGNWPQLGRGLLQSPGMVYPISDLTKAFPAHNSPDRKSTRLNSSHANISYA